MEEEMMKERWTEEEMMKETLMEEEEEMTKEGGTEEEAEKGRGTQGQTEKEMMNKRVMVKTIERKIEKVLRHHPVKTGVRVLPLLAHSKAASSSPPTTTMSTVKVGGCQGLF